MMNQSPSQAAFKYEHNIDVSFPNKTLNTIMETHKTEIMQETFIEKQHSQMQNNIRCNMQP